MDYKNKKIWIVATYDTKCAEANYIKDLIQAMRLPVHTIDISANKTDSSPKADITAKEVAVFHPHGESAVFTNDRGTAIAGMADAFTNFISKRDDVGAIIGIGGSGGTSMITQAMRALPIGLPKLMVSTMASSDVRGYIGSTDIIMMPSVTDIAGLNSISRRLLANAAGLISGAFKQSLQAIINAEDRRAIGLTMFGVTTPCVQEVRRILEQRYDCVIFHATGTGGQSMEKLLDDHFLCGLLDLTTTEVCDFLFGGVLACNADRFGAVARTKMPYVGSCGALDMINFNSFDSVPEMYKKRKLYRHNQQVTLMRTSPQENKEIGEWIAGRLNTCMGQVRMLLPERGVSALDAPDQPFWDPEANAALFEALEKNLHQTKNRQLIRVPFHINSPEFANIAAQHFLEISPATVNQTYNRFKENAYATF